MKSKKNLPTEKNGSQLAKLDQSDIPALLKTVIGKIAALKGNEKDEKTTKGKVLPGFNEIEKIDKVSTLLQALSSIRAREKAYASAIDETKDLGVTLVKFPFKLEDFTADQWISDIKVRISVLSNKAELDKLNKIRTKLEENLSAKDKLARDLAEIGNILTDDTALE